MSKNLTTIIGAVPSVSSGHTAAAQRHYDEAMRLARKVRSGR